MVTYYKPHANGKDRNYYFGEAYRTQKAARKYCIEMLKKYPKLMVSFDIYASENPKRPYFAQAPSRDEIRKYAHDLKLIGSVHIDRGLPEYIDTKLRPHPLNQDGSFKKM